MAKKATTAAKVRTIETNPNWHSFKYGGKIWRTRKGESRPPQQVAVGMAFTKALNHANTVASTEPDEKALEKAFAALDLTARRMFRLCVVGADGNPPSEDTIEKMVVAGCHRELVLAARPTAEELEGDLVDPMLERLANTLREQLK